MKLKKEIQLLKKTNFELKKIITACDFCSKID